MLFRSFNVLMVKQCVAHDLGIMPPIGMTVPAGLVLEQQVECQAIGASLSELGCEASQAGLHLLSELCQSSRRRGNVTSAAMIGLELSCKVGHEDAIKGIHACCLIPGHIQYLELILALRLLADLDLVAAVPAALCFPLWQGAEECAQTAICRTALLQGTV